MKLHPTLIFAKQLSIPEIFYLPTKKLKNMENTDKSKEDRTQCPNSMKSDRWCNVNEGGQARPTRHSTDMSWSKCSNGHYRSYNYKTMIIIIINTPITLMKLMVIINTSVIIIKLSLLSSLILQP